ncbi:hypothetical protein [Klebsiella michiganensis]|uniref:hypothetical protein n=2 Tax=Enterobacterales TaxID=91347 RepID=UPI003B2747EA
MKMGEHMEPVIELLEELNGNNTDAKLKLLALVISEYMINADVTGFEVTAGKMKVSVDISVEEKPMNKSTITRERLQELVAGQSGFNLRTATHEESQELARIAMAALDCEPVAWLLSGGGAKNVVCFDSGNAYADPLREVTPLYRHAQQPVVPDEKPMPNPLSMYAVDAVAAIAEVKGWNTCRAAMLNGGKS